MRGNPKDYVPVSTLSVVGHPSIVAPIYVLWRCSHGRRRPSDFSAPVSWIHLTGPVGIKKITCIQRLNLRNVLVIRERHVF